MILEAIPLGGILVTTREALGRFFSRLAVAREQRFLDREKHEGRREVRRRKMHQEAVRQRLAAEHGV